MNFLKTLIVFMTLPLSAVFAIEGTARPVFNPAADMARMRVVPVCPTGTPVIVSGSSFACGAALPNLSATVRECAANEDLRGIAQNGTIRCCRMVETRRIAASECTTSSFGTTPADCPAGETTIGMTTQSRGWCRGDSGGNSAHVRICGRQVCRDI